MSLSYTINRENIKVLKIILLPRIITLLYMFIKTNSTIAKIIIYL